MARQVTWKPISIDSLNGVANQSGATATVALIQDDPHNLSDTTYITRNSINSSSSFSAYFYIQDRILPDTDLKFFVRSDVANASHKVKFYQNSTLIIPEVTVVQGVNELTIPYSSLLNPSEGERIQISYEMFAVSGGLPNAENIYAMEIEATAAADESIHLASENQYDVVLNVTKFGDFGVDLDIATGYMMKTKGSSSTVMTLIYKFPAPTVPVDYTRFQVFRNLIYASDTNYETTIRVTQGHPNEPTKTYATGTHSYVSGESYFKLFEFPVDPAEITDINDVYLEFVSRGTDFDTSVTLARFYGGEWEVNGGEPLILFEISPEVPSNLSPANNETVGSIVPFSATVVDVEVGDRVKLVVDYSATSDFSSNVVTIESDFLESGQTATVYSNLIATNGVYYWRAKAVDTANLESFYTTTRIFTVHNNPPDIPTELYPINNAIVNQLQPEFSARVADSTDQGNVKLEILLADNLAFTNANTLLTTMVASGKIATVEVSDFFLNNATIYYWKARSYDGVIYSDYSEVQSFTTQKNAPSTPVNLLPANDTAIGTTSINVSATSHSEMVYFNFQLSRDKDFATVQTDYTSPSLSASAEIFFIDLSAGNYYWRVRAQDSSGQFSGFSTIRSVYVNAITTGTVYPEAILASTNLNGTVSNVADGVGVTNDATWLAAASDANTSVRVSFPLPAAGRSLRLGADLQVLKARVRTTTTGASPTVSINFYEGGVLIASGPVVPVTSTTGLVTTASFDANLLTDKTGANVEAVIEGTYSRNGGSRAKVEVGGIEWSYDLEPVVRDPAIADTTPPFQTTSIVADTTQDTVRLTWENPLDSDFNYTEIYRNNVLIEPNHVFQYYNDYNLEPETSYTYKLIAVDNDGNKAAESTVVATTTSGLQGEVGFAKFDSVWVVYQDTSSALDSKQTLYGDELLSTDSEQMFFEDSQLVNDNQQEVYQIGNELLESEQVVYQDTVSAFDQNQSMYENNLVSIDSEQVLFQDGQSNLDGQNQLYQDGVFGSESKQAIYQDVVVGNDSIQSIYQDVASTVDSRQEHYQSLTSDADSKQTVYHDTSVAADNMQAFYESLTFANDIKQVVYEDTTFTHDSKQVVYENALFGTDSKQVMYEDVSRTNDSKQALYQDEWGQVDSRQSLFQDGQTSNDNRQMHYEYNGFSIDGKHVIYEDSQNSSDIVAVIFEDTVVDFDTFVEMYQNGVTGLTRNDIKIVYYQDDSGVLESRQVLFQDIVAALDSEQSWYQDQSVVVESKQSLFQSLVASLDSKQTIFEDSSGGTDSNQVIYQDNAASFDNKQTLYHNISTVFDNQFVLYHDNKLDSDVTAAFFQEGSSSVESEQSLYQDTFNRSDSKQLWYENSSTQNDIKQVLYFNGVEANELRQVFYQNGLLNFDTAMELFKDGSSSSPEEDDPEVRMSNDIRIIIYQDHSWEMDSKQSVYQSGVDQVDSKQVLYQNSLNVADSKQIIYHDFLARSDSRIAIYQNDKADVDSRQSIYQDTFVNGDVRQFLHQNGSLQNDSKLILFSDHFTSGDTKHVLYQDTLSAIDSKQLFYEALSLQGDARQVFYEGGLWRIDSKQTLFQDAANRMDSKFLMFGDYLNRMDSLQAYYEQLSQKGDFTQFLYQNSFELTDFKQNIYQDTFNRTDSKQLMYENNFNRLDSRQLMYQDQLQSFDTFLDLFDSGSTQTPFDVFVSIYADEAKGVDKAILFYEPGVTATDLEQLLYESGIVSAETKFVLYADTFTRNDTKFSLYNDISEIQEVLLVLYDERNIIVGKVLLKGVHAVDVLLQGAQSADAILSGEHQVNTAPLQGRHIVEVALKGVQKSEVSLRGVSKL